VVRSLLKRMIEKSKQEAKTGGLLHKAVRNKNGDVVKMLLKEGFDADEVDEDGMRDIPP
jgi:hypothetical protein